MMFLSDSDISAATIGARALLLVVGERETPRTGLALCVAPSILPPARPLDPPIMPSGGRRASRPAPKLPVRQNYLTPLYNQPVTRMLCRLIPCPGWHPTAVLPDSKSSAARTLVLHSACLCFSGPREPP